MQVTLKRGTPIEFTFQSADGTPWLAEIPAITVGQYRAAMALESEKPDMPAMDRLVKQALILCGEAHADFVNALDAEQAEECVQALVAAYSGMNPEAMVEVLRGQKKKTLLEMVLSATAGPSSENSTS